MSGICNINFQPKMNVYSGLDQIPCDSSYCWPLPPIFPVECGCVEQIKNVISQLITLYPAVDITVITDTGDYFTGRPKALIPVGDSAGLFTLANSAGIVINAISLCRIAKIRVPSVTLFQGITYLPSCTSCQAGCEAKCEAAIRSYLATFAPTAIVEITTSNNEISIGTIYKIECGIVVLLAQTTGYPIFISTCKIESVSPHTDT